MPTGLILFAHGARDPRWAEPFERLRHKVLRARPELRVQLAYLEQMRPNLDSAVDELVRAGCRAIRIAPVFLGQGGHVRDDLPVLVQSASSRHPDTSITLAEAVGESDAVLDAIAAACIAALTD